MDLLTSTSLDWSLQHIRRYGDTDVLPVPFEFDAIAGAWDWLREELALRDLEKYSLGPFRRFLVPKPSGGFRFATQLDPLDSIVYT